MPAWVRIEAARTSSACSASTPAVRYSTPTASGAATITSSPRISTASCPGLGERAALVVDLGRIGWRLAVEHGAGAGDQLGDQAGLPVAPDRRTGRRGVGDRQRVQQVEQLARSADRVGHGGDRHRVVEVAARRGVGQQQVMAGQRDHRRDIAGLQAHPLANLLGVRGPDHGMVTSRVALADVVQQRAQQEEIRARHLAGEPRGLGGRLEQVPVDGEAVHRVVLGPCSAPRPIPG